MRFKQVTGILCPTLYPGWTRGSCAALATASAARKTDSSLKRNVRRPAMVGYMYNVIQKGSSERRLRDVKSRTLPNVELESTLGERAPPPHIHVPHI